MHQPFKDHTPDQRVTHWLEQLAWNVEALLQNIDLDELSAKDRLTLAVKYIEQMQRFLLLSSQIEATTNNSEHQEVIEAMRAWMRGPYSSEAEQTEGEDLHAHRSPIA